MNENKTNKPQKKKNELLYFALRNTKLRIGLGIIIFFLIFTFIGPLLTQNAPNDYIGPANSPPSAEYWFGTTSFGQDVFSQFVHSLGPLFLVGIIGGGIGTLIGMLIGFTAGYKGGIFDEILNMLTNIALVIPTFAILLIIAAYLEVRGILVSSLFIGFTSWPWTARAVRSQTFSLKAREYIELAKISGMKSPSIIIKEIAPNMLSYLVMAFILQFGGAVLAAATLDFIGLGPTDGISMGLMMNNAVLWCALQFGYWWWFVPPGLAISIIVGALYITNVGLDEVFNPKLREM